MRLKEVLLEVDCGGHVSERTFNIFLEKIGTEADNLFDGYVFVKEFEEG